MFINEINIIPIKIIMYELVIGISMVVICILGICCCECFAELCYDNPEPEIEIPVTNPINSI